MTRALALVLLAAPLAARAAGDCAALKPLAGVWSGTVTCRRAASRVGAALQESGGCLAGSYTAFVGDQRQDGKLTVVSAGKPGLFRVSAPQQWGPLSFLAQADETGRKLALLADPQAEGLAALVALTGSTRLNPKLTQGALRFGVKATGMAAQALQALGQDPSDACSGTLKRAPSKPAAP